MTTSSTSPTLIDGLHRHSGSAWNRFVPIYGPMIYQWARRLGLQPADASDVTQDTLTSVFKDIAQFDHQSATATFRGWLWTIMKRRIADARRGGGDEIAIGSAFNIALDAAAIEREFPPGDESRDHSGVLGRVLATYRPQHDERAWKAFWFTVVEGRSPDEVADTLGISRWAVYKARARILQRLREDVEIFTGVSNGSR